MEHRREPRRGFGVLCEGANLVDPARRLVFSVHGYDVWGFPNDGSDDCSNRYSDAQRDARFRSYVDRVHGLGFPLLVGELGFRPTDQATSGLSIHGEYGGAAARAARRRCWPPRPSTGWRPRRASG